MTQKSMGMLALLLLVVGFCHFVQADEVLKSDPAEVVLYGKNFKWDTSHSGMVPTCITQDLQGNIWVGTEDMGVWKFDIIKGEIVCMGRTRKSNARATGKDYLSLNKMIRDNTVYALACDKQGRIWAGHASCGVSVFDGVKWKNYDTMSGPLGERIFDIQINPVSGDVWLATSLGLTRYRPAEEEWLYYTRHEGLPSDQVSCIAFDKSGMKIYAGTQCNGIATGVIDPDNSQMITWSHVEPPVHTPFKAQGKGLPSGCINGLAVAQDGVVYAATDRGLAYSDETGKNWQFLRGGSMLKRAKELYLPPRTDTPELRAFKFSTQMDLVTLQGLVADNFPFDVDFISSINIDPSGNLWLGRRTMGCTVYNPHSFESLHHTNEDNPGRSSKGLLFNRVFFPDNAQPLLLVYGRGVLQSAINPWIDPEVNVVADNTRMKYSAHPSPAKAPSSSQLTGMMETLLVDGDLFRPGSAAYLGEDWQTTGDWLGRYGKQYAALFGLADKFDKNGRDHYPCIMRKDQYWVEAQKGPHLKKKDKGGVYYWINAKQTTDRRALYDPIHGYRRLGECNDGGHRYGKEWDGPDLWLKVTVPEGVQQLSLYFINAYEHEKVDNIAYNIYRSFDINVRKFEEKEVAQFSKPLAKAKVEDYFEGVYKSFLLRGPAKYWVQIKRNHAHNCPINGVFIDQLKGILIEDKVDEVSHAGSYHAPFYSFTNPVLKKDTYRLWKLLNNCVDDVDNFTFRRYWQRLCLRSAKAQAYPTNLRANMRWRSYIWSDKDRQDFDMKAIGGDKK